MTRITKEEIKNSTFTTKNSENTIADFIPVKREEVNYTFSGMEDGFDGGGCPVLDNYDEDKVLARLITDSRGTKYLIRVASDGLFFNPLGIHNKSLFRKKTSAPPPKFVEVNETCFGFYKHFLSSKLEKFLREAQRQV